jgi:hypothetical protein
MIGKALVIHHKGIRLSKKAMEAVEARLKRDPQ